MKQSPRVSGPLHEVFLVTLISLIAVGSALGGFLIGRHLTRDAFIERMSTQGTLENTSLVSAGSTPLNLFQVVGKSIDDPVIEQALARIYDVPIGNRDALVNRLRTVVWAPPYRPAPFVGHMARPFFGDDLHINILGFRDQRETYLTKPERTVRIFITGGSTAWGSGTSSQKNTISYLLEQMLNGTVSRATGYQYEVINAAFPAWSTTQEKLLIQQRLVDFHPDLIIMLSGNNDVHWALEGRDIRWFYTYMDQNYQTLLNETYKASSHPEWTSAFPLSSQPVQCTNLARITADNVEDAASVLERVQAHLVFALQPNVISTSKRLSKHEQQLLASQNKPYWDSCYEALRNALGGLSGKNYRLIDLSRSFGEVAPDTEMFIDSYHFADRGNRLVAQALANQIDWPSIVPGAAVKANTEPLRIVSFDPIEATASKPFNQQPDGTSAIRVVPGRLNWNLLVVFDQSVLPTKVAEDAVTGSIPVSLYAMKGEHKIYLVDSMTGETSAAVVFHSR